MSESSGSKRFASGLALVAVWIFLLAISILQYHSRAALREEEAARRATTQENYAANKIQALTGVRAPGPEICANGRDCTEKDLYQQWRAAEGIAEANDIANKQLLLAALGTGLLWWGLILNRNATRAATDAVEEARKANIQNSEQARKELRAYITVTAGGIKLVMAQAIPAVVIERHNDGQTPAHYVGTYAKFEFAEYDNTDAIDILKKEFVQLAGQSIGPGKFLAKTIPLERALTTEDIHKLNQKKAALIVYGCVAYKDVFGDLWGTNFFHQYTGKPREFRYTADQGVVNPYGNHSD